jgi:hypothetical protein
MKKVDFAKIPQNIKGVLLHCHLMKRIKQNSLNSSLL